MNISKSSIILAGCLVWSHGASGAQFQAALAGAKVGSAPASTRARGLALFNFKRDFSRMSFRLKLRKADGLASTHLHCAPAGVAGPVIADLLGGVGGGWRGNLNLTATLTSVNLDQAAECAAAIGNLADLANAMAKGQIYVNIPSAAYPDGEIRGQIESTGATTSPATPQPANTPTSTSTSSATATSGPSTGTAASTGTGTGASTAKPHTGISAVSTPTAATLHPNLAPASIVQRTTLPTHFNPPCPSGLNPQCSQAPFNPPCPSTFGAPCSTAPNPALFPAATVFPFTTVTTVSTTTFR